MGTVTMPCSAALLALSLSLSALLSVARAQQSTHKYKFFCGSSFADIQADTCAQRQWCPSSSDDECLIPGHTCFANTPCDARLIEGVSMPTYSLSQHADYRDPSDKMFCGTSYQEALSTCEAGGEKAIARHCPNTEGCPPGMFCFIDMPCSHFVLTSPDASPLMDVGSIALSPEEMELPDPGDMTSHTFCGPTFAQAAAACSSQTWCRTGTSQECPNGETCFVDVHTVNPDCEINKIAKKEYEAAKAAAAKTPVPAERVPTAKPTNHPLSPTDPKNNNFCGTDWTDASTNCDLRRHCPNGNSDCEDGMECQTYTSCNASRLTGTPTDRPVSMTPTESPERTEPTGRPTTAKPSREPTHKPSGEPTPKPTGVPSKRPTHSPLAYDDLRRQFWCGLGYWDAMTNCPQKCPSGSDDECPTAPGGERLKCLSGVTDCKNEMGMRAYGAEEEEGDEKPDKVESRPVSDSKPVVTASDADATIQDDGSVSANAVAEPAEPEYELMGPYDEDMVRVVLYGIDSLTSANLNRWKKLTTNYLEEFYNNYPTQNMLASGEEPDDEIRAGIFDVEFTLSDVKADPVPEHSFDSLVVGEVDKRGLPGGRRNLRSRRGLESKAGARGASGLLRSRALQEDEDVMVMITYTQSTTYRSSLDVINEDVRFVNERPLATAEYRAAYVNYLRGAAFGIFSELEYASRFLYTDFPTASPSGTPSSEPTMSPVVPGQPSQSPVTDAPVTPAPTGGPPTSFPTSNFGCNLCRPGQYGVDAELIFNGEVQRCVQVYNWFLVNDTQGSGSCRVATEEMNSLCCRDGLPTPPQTASEPAPQPTSNSQAEPSNSVQQSQVQTAYPTQDFGCNLCQPGQYGVNADVVLNGVQQSCQEAYQWFLSNHYQGSGDCRGGQAAFSSTCCAGEITEPAPRPAPVASEPVPEVQPRPAPVVQSKPTVTAKPTAILEIPVDENGLPDAASLAETYYCGDSWDSVDRNCDNAQACPSGTAEECPGSQQCIAFTNCGGKFAFVSNPSIEGGGPDADLVRSTFYCGTSMQFLENVCDGATPCPNGPNDCEGDGEKYGCFAFTGCNANVDPGMFVGFLRPPDEDDVNVPLPVVLSDAADTFYCAEDWSTLNGQCVDGIPVGARPCPSGNMLECDDGQGCFAFACNNIVGITPGSSPTSMTGDYTVEDLDVLKNTFFCGVTLDEIDNDCDSAIPCPTGEGCPEGTGCFAFSQCGGVDIGGLVDTFGQTDRPTRAPTVPIEQVCDEANKMSLNVGYWQSWSIYRDEDCQRMNTASFDASPYTHVIYSFASIDSSYRLEAWDGTYDNEVPLYKEFNTVKQRQPGVKTMIAVGGWTHNDPGPMQKRFSQMASSKTNRQTFAKSVVNFLRTYGFDGLDLDWEYPAIKDRGGKRADYDNYVLMTKEIRNAFNAAPEPFELSVAITLNTTKLEMGFDLAGLSEYVDFFNLMAYDLWGSWDPKQTALAHTDIRMIDEAVEYMSHFIQKSQLVFGLGSYARTYTLADDDCLELGCPFDGPGKSGCEGTDGFLPYFEIADLVTTRQYDTVLYDEDTMSMVMVTDGNRLISYDNTVSFNRKLDYAEENCFLGGMVWAIDMLKDSSNPLSSNNGNSALTGDPSDQSFCGFSYSDVLDGCKQPCPSGDSSQCSPGQQCFANTGCSIDSIGDPPPTKCRLCPDPSTQGIKDWLEIDYGGESTTCGDADMAVVGEFAKGSEECDAAKQALGDQCCYNYPDNPCMLCRTETVFMDLRALAEIDFNGETMTCFDLSKRLSPEENDSGMCMSAQKEHFDACCYNQCTLCEGQGIKWWNEVMFSGGEKEEGEEEAEEEPLNCGELDAKLYADETEAEEDTCREVLSEYKGQCCYDYPDDPCDVCTKGGEKLTLMPNEEIDYEGSTFTCAEVNNFLSPFESSSKQCEEVQGMAIDTCCFDRCSLCGEGARLDRDVLVELEDGEGTCADIESSLFTEKVLESSEECTETRTLNYDACCFEIPSDPCQLCATDQYMHHTTTIDFNDDEMTCKSANNYLMERFDTSSNTCSEAKAVLGETCCYEICNICGEFDLDWDVFVNFEGEDMSCGDFNEFFREEAIVDGSDQCSAVQGEFFDTCCYTSPSTSCQLCKRGDEYFEVNDNVQVDFNGPTTCYEVASFLSRRTEDSEQACSVVQTSLFDECCYEKCNLSEAEGTYPDWGAEVEMDGNTATCLELDTAIKEAAIANESPECQSLKDAFSPTCSYQIPQNACDLCPSNAVSISAKAGWNGKEMMCSDIKSRISSREESDSQVCLSAQQQVGAACCIDQCEICEKPQKTDPVLTVYHEGATKQCTEVDNYFYEKSILRSSEECSSTRDRLQETCCFETPASPCNLCQKGSEFFDVMGANSVDFMGEKISCSDVSDLMFRREEQDGETCAANRDAYFDACCDSKCSLCEEMGLEAGVKVSFEGRMQTCLELDLSLGPASIEKGSDECSEVVEQFKDDCCYKKPDEPCQICAGENFSTKKDTSVLYLGTETKCDQLSNYLGSREEQQGQACQIATTQHSDTCCYEHCSLCGDGKADWETFVNYNGRAMSCGDFEWVLRGDGVAADDEECGAVKGQFYDTCCYEPPEKTCNLCHVDGEWLDVNADLEINVRGSATTCFSLYNSLIVRESASSDKCQDTKDNHAEECCFEKCNMCQFGILDVKASVDMDDGSSVSCVALDQSFSRNAIVEGSQECSAAKNEYAEECCFQIPDDPCRLCSGGAQVSVDGTVDFYGDRMTCGEVGNMLSISEEATSDSCASTRQDFSDQCCFDSCSICPDGYNLNWEVNVEYNRANIACGEFDQIIRANAVQKNTQECGSLQSTYSSACCYNYATAGGGLSPTTTLATITTTGYLSTNLDTSDLSPSQKNDAMEVFENLIKSTLQSQGVLPNDAKVTVVDIDDNGVVAYEIEMQVNDSSIAETARPLQTVSAPLREDTSSLEEVATTAMAEIDNTLSDSDSLKGIAEEIRTEAAGVADSEVAEELANINLTGLSSQGTSLENTGDSTEVSATGTLDTNIDAPDLTIAQKQEAQDVVGNAIQSTLENQGVLPQDSQVTVTDISETGEVSYEVGVAVDSDTIANSVVNAIDGTLSNAATLQTISTEIQQESASSTVTQELANADVSGFELGESTVDTKEGATQVNTDATVNTGIDTSNLSDAEESLAQGVVENTIQATLQQAGVLPEGATVTVLDIDDTTGVAQLQIGSNIENDLVADSVVSALESAVTNPATLQAIEEEIKNESLDATAAAGYLADVSITDITLGDSTVKNTEDATQVTTSATVATSLDTSNLSQEQIDIAEKAIGSAITSNLQSAGVLPDDASVEVNSINPAGQAEVGIIVNVDPETIADSIVGALLAALGNQGVQGTINNAIIQGADDTSVPNDALSAATISDFEIGDTTTEMGEDATQVSTSGTANSNLDLSNLNDAQKAEAQEVISNSIESALESAGVLPQEAEVTVTDIDEQTGEVSYDIEVAIESDMVADSVVGAISAATSGSDAMEEISAGIRQESTDTTSVAQQLSTTTVTDFSVGEATVTNNEDGATQVNTQATVATNLNAATLSDSQLETAESVVEASIGNALESSGVIPQGSSVNVTNIGDNGEVSVDIEVDIDPETIATSVVSAIDNAVSDSETLDSITDAIKDESSSSQVAENLGNAEVTSFNLGDTEVETVGDSTQITTTGTVATNIDASKLSDSETGYAEEVVATSISNTLQSAGVIPQDATVNVTSIDEATGEAQVEIGVNIDNELVAESVVNSIDNTLSDTQTLNDISNEINQEAKGTSVEEPLSAVSINESTPGETVVRPAESTDVVSSGTIETNLDTSGLSAEQKDEVETVIENSIEQALESEGVLPDDAKVTVTNIDDETGEVSYEININVVDSEIGSELEAIASAIMAEIESILSNAATLKALEGEVKKKSKGTSLEPTLSGINIDSFELGDTSLSVAEGSTIPRGRRALSTVLLTTSGVLNTNIDPSKLSYKQKAEASDMIEDSISKTLESKDVLPSGSKVTVTDLNNKGEVFFTMEVVVGGVPEKEQEAVEPETPKISTLETLTEDIVNLIDETLSSEETQSQIAAGAMKEAEGTSVADELSDVSVENFLQGDTTVEQESSSATGAGPCNLCKAGEISLDTDILFNGVETSCPEIYKFLSTQTEAGSDECNAGKEALQSTCCMKKCDLCSGGGLPDWYAMVNVNDNTMTCLELDGIIVESQIESGSAQCSEVINAAAPSCCYEPPTTPCNMCKTANGFGDVMTSVTVEYGGTTATCGQIFNTLFSREEHESETCSILRQDLASQCCYSKCSLCGDLQVNAAMSVMHDETRLGCSEFDSYIFASNFITEGTDECSQFQQEHGGSCCYDVQCNLCARGNDIWTTKEDAIVPYGGSDVTCGEVANFLYQKAMSQDNVCIAAQENIFNNCCFKQCEMCGEAGATINWAANTIFKGQAMSCTDVYWSLMSDAIEVGHPTCSAIGQVSGDCCYQIPQSQCTLCKDDNAVTYNTRWNKDVTVNGVTKTCGDFNTLLSTQEDDSQTCSLAKDEIFSECCFAGSDTLVAIANDAESDAMCQLCPSDQVGVNQRIIFNNGPTTCKEVYDFLVDNHKESSTTCKSAQVKLREECCMYPDDIDSSIEQFGMNAKNQESGSKTEGEGSVTSDSGLKESDETKKKENPWGTSLDSWTVGINSSTRMCSTLSLSLFSLIGGLMMYY